jgi:hypothetical protein
MRFNGESWEVFGPIMTGDVRGWIAAACNVRGTIAARFRGLHINAKGASPFHSRPAEVALDIRPITPAIGAEIHGVQLSGDSPAETMTERCRRVVKPPPILST